jgi:two-component system, chemotaxis family, chemotaxis protein CheY
MKLLIVDDSVIVRRAIERTLVGARFTEIRVANNGRLGVEEFKRFRPEVVTMDITMPDMDGLTAVELILKEDENAIILVVSALADRSTAVEAVDRGASGFLLKPFTTETLEEAINDVLT